MNRIVLHIGLPKTASTFLQHNVFPNIPGIIYQNKYNDYLDYKLLTNNNIILISNENIPSTPYSKGEVYDSFFKQFKHSLIVIKSIFKDPCIIVCFREPSRFIYSNYKQFLHEGGTLQWEDYFSFENDNELLNKENYFFSSYVEFLKSHFKPERLFLYDFDDFKKDNQKIVNEICTFIQPDFVKGTIELDATERSNPSVNYRFEKTLIKLNKLDKQFREKWGYSMQLKLFGKILNPRVFCQYILPKVIKTEAERDLTKIKKYYAKDWQMTKCKIEEVMSINQS